jgi:hypothetical protein
MAVKITISQTPAWQMPHRLEKSYVFCDLVQSMSRRVSVVPAV